MKKFEEISEVETAGQTTEGEIAEVQTTEGETADSEKNMNTNHFRHWCKNIIMKVVSVLLDTKPA